MPFFPFLNVIISCEQHAFLCVEKPESISHICLERPQRSEEVGEWLQMSLCPVFKDSWSGCGEKQQQLYIIHLVVVVDLEKLQQQEQLLF